VRIAVVGDTRHHLGPDGRPCAHDAVASQLEQWAALFDDVVLCVPVHGGEPPPAFRPYRSTNLSLAPLRPGGGPGLRHKAVLVARIPGWAVRIRRALRQVDAVHLRAPCNVALVGILLTALAPKRHRYAIYAGSWEGYPGEPWSYRAQRKLLGRGGFGGLVTVYARYPPAEPHVVSLFSPAFGLDEWEAEGPAVDAKLAALEGLGAARPVRMVTVGELSPHKNQATVVRAVKLLHDQGLDARLDVVGGGPLGGDLAALVRSLELEEAVRLRGPLPRQLVMAGYRAADFNVLASRTEGYPKVVVEGMAAGAVAVTSRFPMSDHLLGDGRRGVTFRADDPSALASQLADLVAAPERVAAMIRAGRDYARTVTLESYQAQVRALLERHWAVALARPAHGAGGGP